MERAAMTTARGEIYELAFIWGVGPRVEEPGINLIRRVAYSAQLEDVRIKRPWPPRSRRPSVPQAWLTTEG